jgi:Xaa-Pro aminopeptidase
MGMRQDLDQLMREQKIDALWVMGALMNNPNMTYFTGIHNVNNADLFKVRGNDPVLYHFVDMEREEARKSMLETHSYFSEKSLRSYLKENNGNLAKSTAMRIREALHEVGLKSGQIAISGMIDLGYGFSIIEQLREMCPQFTLISFLKDSPIETVRMTKNPDEVESVRKMGEITRDVVAKVQNFLQSQKTINQTLVFPNGSPVTVGNVKSQIDLWLAELGADSPEETIFSIGKDSAVPHNCGNLDDEIKLGVPIVFDIFPCEKGGGYFYDFTRTWCLGYASEEITNLHKQVLEVHHKVIESLEAGQSFKKAHDRTCQLFSEMGHITIADNSKTQSGYLHSVGHGIGLNVHEKPFSGSTASPDDLLIPGVIFTIEPGLYFPEKEVGIRIEDTLYLNENKQFEILADYPYDLVIPMNEKL